jgi:hypothetical protein
VSTNDEGGELALNLWAYLDQGMGLVYALAGKAYALTGSEEEKLALLHQLAPTDHLTVKRQAVPKEFEVLNGDETHEGAVAPGTLREAMAQAFEGVIQSIEAELPLIPNFVTNEQTPQRIPQDSLSCLTFLLEDDAGNVTPITSREQSEELFVEQQKRELMQTFGLLENEAEEIAQQWAKKQRDGLTDE